MEAAAPAQPTDADRVLARLSDAPELLTSAVRAALGDPHASVIDWTVEQLRSGAGNPTSDGLYRLRGLARDGGGSRDWTLVLKAVQSPRHLGYEMEGPDHWNYWLRELRAFQSGLLDDLTGPVVAPRFFGGVEHPDERAWLWLEDLGDFDGSNWPSESYVAAAARLGQLHASVAAGSPLATAPWRSRDLLRGWCQFTAGPVTEMLGRARELGLSLTGRPDSGRGHDNRDVAVLIEAIEHPEPLLAALDALPQVLCHHDTNVNNLLFRAGAHGQDELVIIDWQLVGTGPVGADIGQLLCDQPHGVAIEDRVLATYTDSLQVNGFDVQPDAVRLGRAAYSVLREGCFAFLLLWLDVERLQRSGRSADPGDQIRERVQRALDDLAAGQLPRLIRGVLDLL